MTRPYRFLLTDNTAAEPPEPVSIESDYVVILAALLCASICVVGLIAVARCAWLRRGYSVHQLQNQQLQNRGMKKKMIEAIPKLIYGANGDDNVCGKLSSSDCAICLSEYENGDEIRVMPLCGHGFHVGCIDTWLSSHSSCPSCRQVLVGRRCKKCGEVPTVSGEIVVLECGDKCRQHNSSRSCSGDYLP